ncbi:hypothetical protein J2W35_003466 [Variovorax boronicumulans]|uniref:hypothetical protein n=1 Tax=Variovorax boronicumulans TaxID=436515 RepID=UPI0027818AF1|nr:hypothetical protein [Variovorax boronicumulans]MDQ0083106.1 hypothetical protein [Variovorax boronicumulans]
MNDAQCKAMYHRDKRDVRMPGNFGLQGGGAMRTQALDQPLRNGEFGFLLFAAPFGFVTRTVPIALLLPQRLGLLFAQQPTMTLLGRTKDAA